VSMRKRARSARLTAEEGFTLAELMVFIGIMIIFLIGIGGMISSGVKSSTASYNLVKISQGANEAMVTMVRQIRVATSINTASTANSIIFTGDVNGDGTDTAVRFDAAGGYLRRGTSAADMSDWIAEVDGVAFTYYYFNKDLKELQAVTPGSAAWTANLTQIRRIDIALAMSRSSVGITIDRDYTGSVTLRNALQ